MRITPSIQNITSKFIFIGGVSRSGKSFLCPIVSSFKKTEMFLINSLAENIAYSNSLKKLDKDLSKYLLKLTFNESVYNLNIGRNLNARKKDYSSFFQYKQPKQYLKRIASKVEGDQVLRKIKKQDHFYPVMFHDVLINPKILLESFKNAKIIYIERHPVEIINEWVIKKYSSKFWKNPRNTTLTFKIKNNFFPYWSLKKIKLMVNSKNEIEKTIYSLGALLLQQKKNSIKLDRKYKKKLLVLKFDNLVSKTNSEVKKICKFLNTSSSSFTKKIIQRQKGNRIIDRSLRSKLKKKYLKFMSKNSKKIFYKLEYQYEKK